MIGYGAIVLALVMTCAASFAYFHNHLVELTMPSGKKCGWGRTFYYAGSAFIAAAALYFLYIILSNQFQFLYVAGYSSRDLPLVYKLSVFWAGQEGSFMLWLIFHVLIGLCLTRKAPLGVMAVFSAIQAALLAILLFKSPFMMLAEPRGDGFGLNPLLQDPFMVIHPPILFLGYAGLTVPFSYAMDGLLSGKHKEWLPGALTWTLFAWSQLGAGIFIGGFWAYKVLGWGGYWAWDPVENSSLVPWLLAGVLVHSIVLAMHRPAAVSLAYFAAIFSFISVLYGTFLTRSGVLSNFSTHSFADEGMGSILAVFVMITSFAALLLYLVRLPSLPQGELFSRVISRESMLLAAIFVLGVLAVIVSIGMSTPLITMLLGTPQSIQSSFYNKAALPLAGCLTMLLALMPLFYAREKTKAWLILVISLAFLFLGAAYELNQPFTLLAVSFAGAAVFSNLWMGYKKLIPPAAFLTHLGIAVMMLGIIISSVSSKSVNMTFTKLETQQVFGYNLTYLGEAKTKDDLGMYHVFLAESAGEKVFLKPYTKLNKNGKSAAREPGIYRSLMSDLYIAPSMESENASVEEVTLHKGESRVIDELQIKFLNVSMKNIGGSDSRIEANLEIAKNGRIELITLSLLYRNGQITGEPVTAFVEHEFLLARVNPGEQAATFVCKNTVRSDKNDKVEVEISQKPLINLVWLGALLITAGTILAFLKRGIRQSINSRLAGKDAKPNEQI